MSSEDPDAQPARWASRQDRRSRDAVLRAFLDADGRLRTIPAKHTKRLLVLDLLAQEFVPGERYPETEVNNRLRAYHDDVAALRRYLVENLFLAREAGVYWRTGGSVELPEPPDPAELREPPEAPEAPEADGQS